MVKFKSTNQVAIIDCYSLPIGKDRIFIRRNSLHITSPVSYISPGGSEQSYNYIAIKSQMRKIILNKFPFEISSALML